MDRFTAEALRLCTSDWVDCPSTLQVHHHMRRHRTVLAHSLNLMGSSGTVPQTRVALRNGKVTGSFP